MYYRLVKMTNWIAIKINSIEDDLENLQVFVSEGTTIAYTDDIETFCDDTRIDINEISVVED